MKFQILRRPSSGSSETLIPFCQTTLYHNPEGHNVNNFVKFFKRLTEFTKDVDTLCNSVHTYLLGTNSDFMNIQGAEEVKMSLLS